MTQPALIIHYHFFKNAGTSFDKALRDNFGRRWAQAEESSEGAGFPSDALRAFIETHPELDAISSHTAQMPEPDVERPIVPVVFLRHPIDRTRSVYEFERSQREPTIGSQRAKEAGITEYIRWRLSRPGDYTIRNFQAQRLSLGAPAGGSMIDRAFFTFARLPFVGLVEDYPNSIKRFEALIRARGHGSVALKTYRVNGSRDSAKKTLGERLDDLRVQLGQVYEELLAANADDMALWRLASDQAGERQLLIASATAEGVVNTTSRPRR